MATILKSRSIYYNDVNLIAKPSVINSRSDVPRELHRIVVSPMESVVGKEFALEANKLGLTICLHRFCKPEVEADIFSSLPNKETVFASIGLEDWDRVNILKECGVNNWLVDIANGYIPNIKKTLLSLISLTEPSKIMVGNIMDKSGVQMYNDFKKRKKSLRKENCGNYEFCIRVGIAGGKACCTSDMTGFNRGQITELIQCSEEAKKLDINIVADGGIKNGNYASKAFGCGAKYVMMGSYFSQASEAYTHLIGDGTYWGGASHKQQSRWGGIKKHSEGKVIKIEQETKPLKILVDDLWGGLSSAVSYGGCKSLTEFIGNGVFEIKENSLPPGDRK